MDIYDPIGKALGLDPNPQLYQEIIEQYKLIKIYNSEPVPPWNKGNGDYMRGEKNPMYGTKRPQYVKDAISKANTGKKNNFLSELNKKKRWWTNGSVDKCQIECPPGFYLGRSKMLGKNNPVNVRWSSHKKL